MKKFFSILLIAVTVTVFAQPKGKAPHMAPVMVKGYYTTLKGDTVRGEVQSNPDDPTDIYKGFNFRPGSTGKVAPMSTKKAKGYGFEGRHFILVPYDKEQDVYIEALAKGRLNFYEFKFHDTKGGEPVISSSYYIQDTQAEEKDAKLKEITPISTNFYKKDMKPFMKDQSMIWNDLDKFVFDKATVVKALKEFNKFYEAK
jgi:hypothetical protein